MNADYICLLENINESEGKQVATDMLKSAKRVFVIIITVIIIIIIRCIYTCSNCMSINA
mgnify:CR=1 FL=1